MFETKAIGVGADRHIVIGHYVTDDRGYDDTEFAVIHHFARGATALEVEGQLGIYNKVAELSFQQGVNYCKQSHERQH